MNVIAISNNIYHNSSLYKKNDMYLINQRDKLSYELLKHIKPHYVFFPHWSYIIPKEIYENFNCIIFHMTDLPFGRGGSPLQNLISRKIYNTKISAIKCVDQLDAGDIYLKHDFNLSEGNALDIYLKAGEIISKMIDEIIETCPVPYPQHGEIVNFKRRTAEQSDISDLEDLETIYDYIRMLDAPNYPKAFLLNGQVKYEFSNVEKTDNILTAKVKIRLTE